MKAQTKAVIASVAVLAMLLSTVGGVTYSWFADTRSTDIETGTAVLDVSYYMYDGTNVMNALTLPNGSQTVEFTLRICNDSPIAVTVTASLEVQRYYAVTTGTDSKGKPTEPLYKELTKNADGTYSANNTTAYSSGNAANWSNLSVQYGSGTAVQFKNGQSPFDANSYTDDTGTYKVRHTTYKAESDQMTVTSHSTEDVKVTMTSTGSFVPYSDLFHFVLRAAQGDIAGQVVQCTMQAGADGSRSGTIQSSDFGDAGILEFTDETSTVRIGKEAFSGQSAITVSWNESETGGIVTRTVTVSNGTDAQTGGWVQYTMVLNGPVWKVASGDGSGTPVPASITYSDGKTTVSFSDPTIVQTHTVVYQKTESA